MWLKVARTNKNPLLICSYFLETVNELNKLPCVVRLDRGTENVHIGSTQQLFRGSHTDELAAVSVMYGASTHNQRIERFWSYLRQTLLQEYMTLFRGYLDSGIVDSSNASHMECLAFCFMSVLRRELQSVVTTWNNHRVRQMKHAECPSGVPNILFEHCDVYGSQDQAKIPNRDIYMHCMEQYANHSVPDCDPEFEEWALRYMSSNVIPIPHDIDSACTLFSRLIRELLKVSS